MGGRGGGALGIGGLVKWLHKIAARCITRTFTGTHSRMYAGNHQHPPPPTPSHRCLCKCRAKLIGGGLFVHRVLLCTSGVCNVALDQHTGSDFGQSCKQQQQQGTWLKQPQHSYITPFTITFSSTSRCELQACPCLRCCTGHINTTQQHDRSHLTCIVVMPTRG